MNSDNAQLELMRRCLDGEATDEEFAQLEELQEQLAAPGFYDQEAETVQASLQALADAESGLESKVARWEQLENLQASLQQQSS